MGVDTAVATTYRRKYVGLQYEALQDASRKWETANIVAVPNTAAEYGTFWNSTRFEIAKQGLTLAIERNSSSTMRWGLVKQRQDTPAWPSNCDKPVRVTGTEASAALLAGSDSSPCAAGGATKYRDLLAHRRQPELRDRDRRRGSRAGGGRAGLDGGGQDCAVAAGRARPRRRTIPP